MLHATGSNDASNDRVRHSTAPEVNREMTAEQIVTFGVTLTAARKSFIDE